MLVSVMTFLLFATISHASDILSGFAKEYLNKNYTPLIVETRPMISTQVSSKLTCLTTCLNENDCSLAVFNMTDNQCAIYNLFPLVDEELLPDANIIVFSFAETIQRK
jgi:hypothetical protein